jgi:hypothetical protein
MFPVGRSSVADNLRDKAIELINAAQLSEKPEAELAQVQEILLKRNPRLLPEFFDAICDFQVGRLPDARKFTAAFLEATVAGRHGDYFWQSTEVILNMLGDRANPVRERVIRAGGELFRTYVINVGRAFPRYQDQSATKVWGDLLRFKGNVLQLLGRPQRSDGLSAGVCSQVFKFCETVVLLFSDPLTSGEAGLRKKGSLENVLHGHPFLYHDVMRVEAAHIVTLMVDAFQYELSQSNYTVLANVLGTIAKHRLTHLDVIMPHLLATLIPVKHLSEQGRKTVVQAAKQHLQTFLHLKHPYVVRWHAAITAAVKGNRVAIVLEKTNYPPPADPTLLRWAATHLLSQQQPQQQPPQQQQQQRRKQFQHPTPQIDQPKSSICAPVVVDLTKDDRASDDFSYMGAATLLAEQSGPAIVDVVSCPAWGV